VIAADIRQLEHIEYTSAPDIIHESAGHAPIISDVKYNQYLSYLGSIGTKALFSSKDYALYESIRELSILKEAPNVDPAKIADAEELVLYNQKNLGEPSEMALLSRLQWWTVEYGLIGDLQNPKIYGAGLLSSIGESSSCMRPSVKKLIYTIDAVNYSYDITQPQPQLFVTPTFQNLIDVLQQFERRMAFRVGGYESMIKAIECKNICTAVYSSGLQVSGIFVAAQVDNHGQLKYIQTKGETELAYNDVQLPGHGTSYHRDGFGSPVGKLKSHAQPLENWDDSTCLAQGLVAGKTVELNFESGISVTGKLEQVLRKEGKIILLTFTDCTVKDQDGKVYFDPAWGNYDMAVGEKIVSVFNGVADKNHLVDQLYVSSNRTFQPKYTEADRTYHAIFQEIRDIREQHQSREKLRAIRKSLAEQFKEDWLASMEILELIAEDASMSDLAEEVRAYLLLQKEQVPAHSKLIADGLRIIDAKLRFE
jgi:phenylalanine-4-hydroxylase